MLGDSVEKRKNIVWRDYDRSMFSIWSKSKKATCAWWESIALSHVKLHQGERLNLRGAHVFFSSQWC
jgi:hypothetical protein